MNEQLVALIRQRAQPLAPCDTGLRPLLRTLVDVRAVLFDVYGTLFVSRSGELEWNSQPDAAAALQSALQALGFNTPLDYPRGVANFHEIIRAHHEQARRDGIEHSEIDIVEVWRRTLSGWSPELRDTVCASDMLLRRFAIEYEVHANPVWPMHNARQCLAALVQANLQLGLISNSQFFTPLLFPALFEASPEQLGFDAGLQFYSFRYGRAKPSTILFEQAARCLSEKKINRSQVVYVGNDMLNDMLPAHQVGFRTCLFAGDARSLRLREGDPRVAALEPEIIVTDLGDLPRSITSFPSADFVDPP